MKRLIICADDFAQSEGISLAISKLCERGIVSAVSCLTSSARWFTDYALLQPLSEHVDIGLHFNLTLNFEAGARTSIGRLLAIAFLKKIDVYEVEWQLNKQLDQFEHASGCAPDHVDGHEHVHCFPQIRDVVFSTLKRRYGANAPYVRGMKTDALTSKDRLKRYVLATASREFIRSAVEKKLPHTSMLSGLYRFTGSPHYATLLDEWMPHIKDDTVLVCHPSITAIDSNDALAAHRKDEYEALASVRFSQSLELNRLVVSRGRWHTPRVL
jgi:chitin disaccharide deacetylase